MHSVRSAWGLCIIGLLASGPALAAGEKENLAERWGPRRQLIQACLEKELPTLEKLYYHLHTHPELAYEEEQTAARLTQELRQLGFDVTTNVGGHGIVCVFKNGAGPTVMIRTDMD